MQIMPLGVHAGRLGGGEQSGVLGLGRIGRSSPWTHAHSVKRLHDDSAELAGPRPRPATIADALTDDWPVPFVDDEP